MDAGMKGLEELMGGQLPLTGWLYRGHAYSRAPKHCRPNSRHMKETRSRISPTFCVRQQIIGKRSALSLLELLLLYLGVIYTRTMCAPHSFSTTMKLQSIVLLWTILLLCQRRSIVVEALSRGSPVCTANRSAPGSVHRFGDYAQLSLPNGGLVITIDGDELVQDAAPMELLTGQPYEVTIRRTQGSFRGVLALLSGGDNNVDTSSVMSLTDSNLQISNPCLIFLVSGTFFESIGMYVCCRF